MRDAAILLGAACGVDPRDPATSASAGKFHADYTTFLDAGGLKGARLGIVRNILGFHHERTRRVLALVVADFVLQTVLIVAGLILFFSWSKIADPVDIGTQPTWSGLVFALGVATVVFTGLESASGLSGEVAVGRRGLKRLVLSAGAVVMVVYVGIAVVAVTALPITEGAAALGPHWIDAPMLSVTTVSATTVKAGAAPSDRTPYRTSRHAASSHIVRTSRTASAACVTPPKSRRAVRLASPGDRPRARFAAISCCR